MMNQFEYEKIGMIQDFINNLMEFVNEGSIEGMIMQIKLNDGSTCSMFTDNLSFIEKLGLLESCKMDVQRVAQTDEYDDEDDE